MKDLSEDAGLGRELHQRLYPRSSETRQVVDLSGVWNFKLGSAGPILDETPVREVLKSSELMPVPASYNDLSQDPEVRDHIGWVWYEREFFADVSWKEDKSVYLRIGSASQHARVWLNGVFVCDHSGGFLPFGANVESNLRYDGPNRLTIAVGNVLDWGTLPPGELVDWEEEESMLAPEGEAWKGYGRPKGYRVQEYHQDFFNYSGIHRPVRLIVTPQRRIIDIDTNTNLVDGDGVVAYQVDTVASNEQDITVRLLDNEGVCVAEGDGPQGELRVPQPQLWKPGAAYLYQFEARLLEEDVLIDVYRLPIGIRTVDIVDGQFMINGKPFYFQGFGKHEDSELRGRGADPVIHIKDFNLLKWIGANSFRTSHYPYCEEILNLADEYGIVVIDEAPAVGMWDKSGEVFDSERINGEMKQHHLAVMETLVRRDRNHPSVVMWCVANEAATWEASSRPYFETLIEAVRSLDASRPVTCAFHSNPNTCLVMDLVDVICINRYFSWYEDPGRLDLIAYQLESGLNAIYEKYGKPVIMSEYGADAIAGFHASPPEMFSEEYQSAMLKEYHKVFDKLDFLIGEHVWNFADFKTKQGVRRAMGNRKGIFTRQRQPKQAAFLLKERWRGQGVGEWRE